MVSATLDADALAENVRERRHRAAAVRATVRRISPAGTDPGGAAHGNLFGNRMTLDLGNCTCVLQHVMTSAHARRALVIVWVQGRAMLFLGDAVYQELVVDTWHERPAKLRQLIRELGTAGIPDGTAGAQKRENHMSKNRTADVVSPAAALQRGGTGVGAYSAVPVQSVPKQNRQSCRSDGAVLLLQRTRYAMHLENHMETGGRRSTIQRRRGVAAAVYFSGTRIQQAVTTTDSPEKEPPVIVLDARHGGADGSCVSVNGVPEKGINLNILLLPESA